MNNKAYTFQEFSNIYKQGVPLVTLHNTTNYWLKNNFFYGSNVCKRKVSLKELYEKYLQEHVNFNFKLKMKEDINDLLNE